MIKPARALLLLCILALPAAWAGDGKAPATAAHAGPGAWMHPDGSQWQQLFRDLKLTPEQKDSLRAIAESYRPRLWDLRQRGQAIGDQLLQTSPQDPGYSGATLAASQAAATLASDTVMLLSQMRVEMDAVLTGDQRRLLTEQWKKRQQRWDQWQKSHGQAPPAGKRQ